MVLIAKIWIKRTLKAMGEKNFGVLAAGIAYFGTLAVFPLLVAIVSITALVVSDAQLLSLVKNVNQFLPGDIAGLVTAQLNNLFGNPSATIAATVVGFAIALFSISGAFDNIMRALSVVNGVKDTRNFFQIKKKSLPFTIGAVMFMLIAIPMMGLTGSALVSFGVPAPIAVVLISARWILLALMLLFALMVLYRLGPARKHPSWHLVLPGAITATVLWMVVTVVFFVYLRYFAHFSDSYSLFAGLIALMLWFNLSAMMFLIGANVNTYSEVHHNLSRKEFLQKFIGRGPKRSR